MSRNDMRKGGLEPPRIAPLDPKSNRYTPQNTETGALSDTGEALNGPENSDASTVSATQLKKIRQKRDDRVRDSYKAGAGDCCEACGWRPKPALRDVAGGKIDRLLAAHHIHPIACGGPDSNDNLVQLCLNCHGIAHHMGRMVTQGSDAFLAAAPLGDWMAAIDRTKGSLKVWIGPRNRRDFFFSMTMLANRAEYVRFAAVGHDRTRYLTLLEEEARRQDAVESVRLNRAFTVESKPREVFGRRRA